jgi:hypothetical protein
MNSQLEPNLGVEDGRLAHLRLVFLSERLEESDPLIAVGRPVECMVKVLGDRFVGPFRVCLSPDISQVDLAAMHTQEVLGPS